MLTRACQPEGLLALVVLTVLALAGLGLAQLFGLQGKTAALPPLVLVGLFVVVAIVINVRDHLSRRNP